MAMPKLRLLTAVLLVTGSTLFAQQLPDAGRQLQQIPLPPNPDRADPVIRIERNAVSAEPDATGQKIRVNSLRVTGQTLFSEGVLVAASGITTGSDLTLSELRNSAAKISAFYNSRGYPLAQA